MEDTNTNEAWLDTVMSCLSNETRRRILAVLRSTDPEVGVNQQTLAERTTERSTIELHHAHLPMLDEVGLVEWDPDDGVVYPGPHFDEVVQLLETIEQSEAD